MSVAGLARQKTEDQSRIILRFSTDDGNRSDDDSVPSRRRLAGVEGMEAFCSDSSLKISQGPIAWLVVRC